MRSLFTGHATRVIQRKRNFPAARKRPYLYRAMRLMRSVYAYETIEENLRKTFRRNARLFELNEFESGQLESLRERGYALAPAFFSRELIDRVAAKTRAVFNRLEERPDPMGRMQNVPQELAGQTIELKHPLIHISDILDLAFHESILKISAHFLGQVPAMYRVALVRDFPGEGLAERNRFRRESGDPGSLQIMIDLADVDGASGSMVYVPGSHSSILGGLSSGPGEQEMDRVYPRSAWAALHGERGSITSIDRRAFTRDRPGRAPETLIISRERRSAST